MSSPDDELRRLLNEAVDNVHPHEGLTTIKSKTKEKKMSARGPVLFGAGGAAIATAAVIGVIAWTGGFGSDDAEDAQPAGSSSQSSEVEDSTPAETESATEPTETASTDPTAAVPVYYIGDGPGEPVLFREFQDLSGDHVRAAVEAAVVGTPQDPDYRNVWPDGAAVNGVEVSDDLITIDLVGVDSERPNGLDEREAELAVQQLVFTAQGAHGEGRVPVQLTVAGSPTDSILGVATAEPLAAASVLETLSLMNITAPAEGATVSGKFTATGVNNGFEAWVGYQILKDGEEVASGFGMAEAWMEDKLFPWEVEVDVSGLEPGEYVLRFHNDDPTGGAEGNGPAEDTRTIIVE